MLDTTIDKVTTPIVGERWVATSIAQKFEVISGPEAQPGLGEWAAKKFVGHRARRVGDRALALVGLTKKPGGYPYDFVLL